jgi:hypothetical protein
MLTHTTEEDDLDVETDSPLRKLFEFYGKFRARAAEQAALKSSRLAEKKARLAVAESNRQFEEIEEMKYYFTQGHRASIAFLHSSPKGKLIDKQYFAVMNALTAIENSGQTAEQILAHQRIALQYGRREIKAIIAGRSRVAD